MTPLLIITLEAEAYGVTLATIKGSCRRREIVRARHAAAYCAYMETEATQKEIADILCKERSLVSRAVSEKHLDNGDSLPRLFIDDAVLERRENAS